MRIAILVLAITAAPSAANAQTTDTRPKAPVTVIQDSAAGAVDSTLLRRPARNEPAFRPFTLLATASSVYESNIEHAEVDAVPSVGGVAGLLARFQNRASRPWIQLEYEVAAHSYTNTDRFDRVSNRARTSLARTLNKLFRAELIGEASLKGSSEDRDVSDQYSVQPRLEWRLDSDRRIRGYATYRLRDYDIDDQDAHNRYVGVEFRQDSDGDREWEAGFRYERNSGAGMRSKYFRRTWYSQYTTPAMGGVLGVELRFRAQQYDGRFVEVEGIDVNRKDERWNPVITYARDIVAGAQLSVQYDFEGRTSNDPEKGYDAHRLLLGLTRRW